MPPRGLLAALFLVATAAGPADGQVASTFAVDAEGWLVRDLNCNNYNQSYATHALSWQASGGDPDAHVSHHDVTNYCSFFSAPAAYLGDKSDYAGGGLAFSLTSTENDWQGSDVVVLIGAGLVVCHELPQLPPQPPLWRRYGVPLEAASFRYNNAGGAVVSAADFVSVLADLDYLLLPAEFGAEVEETVGLDSVLLSQAPSAAPDLPRAAVRPLGAHPNPFNPATTITFELPEARTVRLTVHDVAGRLVSVLREGEVGVAGPNAVAWQGRDDRGRAQPSGVYLVRLEAGNEVATTRIMLVR